MPGIARQYENTNMNKEEPPPSESLSVVRLSAHICLIYSYMQIFICVSVCVCLCVGGVGGMNTTHPETTKEQSTPFKPKGRGRVATHHPSFSWEH